MLLPEAGKPARPRRRRDRAPIAIRGSNPGSGRKPIRVQAGILRGHEGGDASASLGDPAHATPGQWDDNDVKRAIRLAQEAGLASYRVEIAPDGTITIVVDGGSD